MTNVAKVKFSQLPPAEDTDIQDSDIIPLVNIDTSKKVTFANFKEYLVSSGFVVEELLNSTVSSAIENLIDGAPEYLDTLKELADAINNDGSFSNNIRDLIEESVANSFQGKTTDDLQEGSVNLYFTTGIADAHFDEKFAGKTTTHLQEGSNLYFTEQRAIDAVIPSIPTDINQLSDTDGLLGSGSGGSGELPTDPEFDSVTATTLNVQDVNFTGTGAVNIVSGNDLNFTAAGNISFNGQLLSDLAGEPGPQGEPGTTDYNDLTNKPDLSTKEITHSAERLAAEVPTSIIAISDNYQTEKVLINNSTGEVGSATLPNVTVYGKVVILVTTSSPETYVGRKMWPNANSNVVVSNSANGVKILMSLGSNGWKQIQTND